MKQTTLKPFFLAATLGCTALPLLAGSIQIKSGARATIGGGVTATSIHAEEGAFIEASGSGLSSTAVRVDGTLQVSASPKQLEIGDLTVGSTGVIDMAINGYLIPGTDYDEITVHGAITLEQGASFFISGTGALPDLGSIILLKNDGADPIIGKFQDIGEGTLLPLAESGDSAKLSYAGGDGNDLEISRRFTAFELWALQHGLTIGEYGNSSLSDDPNSDGKNNLWDFAFGKNPLASVVSSVPIYTAIKDLGDPLPAFTLTMPVRANAVWSGAGASPTLTKDSIRYTIHGDSDLQLNSQLVVDEVSPALSDGLPALDAGYVYRTFKLQDTTQSTGFLFVELEESN
ncbi:hypothetical protein Rhal01_01023 [Rubritalea halochordaticola]|uniref:G8 domain-containing protein n=1 Tax=Rubritalea halochordaticola TaxID=714537 RepID=A0ABP9UYT9_9BACT